MEAIEEYCNRNYSRPEQPDRPFNQDDLRWLIQHLDFKIRRLEGMRDIEGRNYLDSNESTQLNRAKFLRKIVEEWRNLKPQDQ